MSDRSTVLFRIWALFVVCGLLAACSGGGSSGGPSQSPAGSAPPAQAAATGNAPVSSPGWTVQGRVVDGPVVGAEVRLTGIDDPASGRGASATSDTGAHFSIEVPDGLTLPAFVTATGGDNLVTGRSPDLALRGLLLERSDATANVTAYTTLMTATVECRGAWDAASVRQTWSDVAGNLDLAWDSSALPDPRSEPVDATNVATVLLSNEALAETVRRAARALSNAGNAATPDQVMAALGCDLADGRLDARGPQVESRVAATAIAAATGVAVELAAGSLSVDGQDRFGTLDELLDSVVAGAPGSVADVPLAATLIDQLRSRLATLQLVYPRDSLRQLATAMATATPATLRNTIRNELTTATRNDMVDLIDNVALSDAATLLSLGDTLAEAATAPAPTATLVVDPTQVVPGEPVRLTWGSSAAESCVAEGTAAWSGTRGSQGSVVIEDVATSTMLSLTCFGPGGSASAAAWLEVVSEQPEGDPEPAAPAPDPQPEPQPAPQPEPQPEPPAPAPEPEPEPAPAPEPDPEPAPAPEPEPEPPQPELELTVAADTVDLGGFATVSWTARHVDDCTAGGGWSGSRAASGTQVVGPLEARTTFTLTCAGRGGSVVEALSVAVRKDVSLAWIPPTQNEDGSPITDLDGYRIHYGARSGDYRVSIRVVDPDARSHTWRLASGTHFVVMTALDTEGNESAYSNEVVRTVE